MMEPLIRWIFCLAFEAKQYVIFKSVNVFFSRDIWLKGCTDLGIFLIKIIHTSWHKFLNFKIFLVFFCAVGKLLFPSLGRFAELCTQVWWHLSSLLAWCGLRRAQEWPFLVPLVVSLEVEAWRDRAGWGLGLQCSVLLRRRTCFSARFPVHCL